jgi:hypothetical protein
MALRTGSSPSRLAAAVKVGPRPHDTGASTVGAPPVAT